MHQKEKIAQAIASQDALTTSLLPTAINDGLLIPLKTGAEIEEEHTVADMLITRCPVSSCSAVIRYFRELFPDIEFLDDLRILRGEYLTNTRNSRAAKEEDPDAADTDPEDDNGVKAWPGEDISKIMPHLRRCCKPGDLPRHLSAQFAWGTQQDRTVHTGKAQWVYVLLGMVSELDEDTVVRTLYGIQGLEEGLFMKVVPMPIHAPTSQNLATQWSCHFWPTVYRKTNPQGPHPSLVNRAGEELANDAAIWMSLAFKIGQQGAAAGLGAPVGACVVMRTDEGPKLVALACDARWNKQDTGGLGNPMAHAVQRVISMVAQKLVRAENRKPDSPKIPKILEFDCFQDRPILPDEEKVFAAPHPEPNGYLCHGLELYTTHEPCTMCSMAILHSRMARAIFTHRMPLTGGLSAELRKLDEEEYPDVDESLGGGRGLGLFWRRELNWSLLAWEFQHYDCHKPLNLSPTIHI